MMTEGVTREDAEINRFPLSRRQQTHCCYNQSREDGEHLLPILRMRGPSEHGGGGEVGLLHPPQ
jgi:hypothetical protein